MIPILYNERETAFDTNGIGMLIDAMSCTVHEELNGQYELTLKYPLKGLYAEYLDYRNIILAKPDPVNRAQPFRIYRILPSSSGTITVYARHLAYDLLKIPVSPFSKNSSAAALVGLGDYAAVDCPFTFRTDTSIPGTFNLTVPKPAWRCLGGSEGSILDQFGGEYEFDRYEVFLWRRRGADRGVSIRYGKNLTTLEQDKNCAECYTGVYPYWADTEGNLVTLTEKIVEVEGTYTYESILTLDLSAEWQEAPTEEQLRERTEAYITANKIGVPTVSWKVEFVQLEQTEEYKDKALLERVLLGDSVTVVFPDMNVNATARAVEAEYDAILERYNSVTLGSVKANLATTLAQQQAEIDRKPSVSLMQSILMTLTSKILGAKGGAVRLLDTDGDGMPDTLYVADDPDPNKALKVWRWNYEGWAGSLTGYNGPFVLGATLEDGLLASAVTAANLVAGTIQSADGGKTFFLDLDNGILKGNFTEFSVSGKSVEDIASDQAEAAADAALSDAKKYADDAAETAVAAQTQQDIFNALTNNGETQGLYLQDGKIYINLEYLGAGQISAEKITLNGLFEVYGGSSPATGKSYLGGYLGYMTGTIGGTGIVTDGVAIYNKAMDCYVIVTTAGVRLQAGTNSLYLPLEGDGAVIEGNLKVKGNITYTGSSEQTT